MKLPRFPLAAWLTLFVLAFGGLLHVALEIYRLTQIAPELRRGPEEVAHVNTVISAARELDRALQEAERAQRGYLLSGEKAYREAHDARATTVSTLVEKLKRLVADQPAQHIRVTRLERQVNSRLAELKRTLEVYGNEGFDAARRAVAASGNSSMEAVDVVLAEIVASEQAQLERRLAHAAEVERKGTMIALLGGALGLLMFAGGVPLLVYSLRTMGQFQSASQDSEQRFPGVRVHEAVRRSRQDLQRAGRGNHGQAVPAKAVCSA